MEDKRHSLRHEAIDDDLPACEEINKRHSYNKQRSLIKRVPIKVHMYDNKMQSITTTIFINSPQSDHLSNVEIQVNPHCLSKACDGVQDWGCE